MLDCLIAGDSIAVGVGAYLRGCTVNAKIGIGSHAIIERVSPAKRVIISSGSNDPGNPNLARNLEAARSRAGEGRVIWIEPIDKPAAAAVRATALGHGDAVIRFSPAIDHVHPRCEGCVARDIEAAYATP